MLKPTYRSTSRAADRDQVEMKTSLLGARVLHLLEEDPGRTLDQIIERAQLLNKTFGLSYPTERPVIEDCLGSFLRWGFAVKEETRRTCNCPLHPFVRMLANWSDRCLWVRCPNPTSRFPTVQMAKDGDKCPYCDTPLEGPPIEYDEPEQTKGTPEAEASHWLSGSVKIFVLGVDPARGSGPATADEIKEVPKEVQGESGSQCGKAPYACETCRHKRMGNYRSLGEVAVCEAADGVECVEVATVIDATHGVLTCVEYQPKPASRPGVQT